MAILTRRQEPQPQTLSTRDPFRSTTEWMRRDPFRYIEPFRLTDPFRLMRDLLRWDPFADMEAMSMMPESAFAPDISVKDTGNAIVLSADVPGVSEDNIEISMTGNRLAISGKREEEREQKEGEQYLAYERSYGNFYRAFVFPETCDLEHVSAELKNGVLHVKIPKKEGMQPKRIKVSGEAGRMVEAGAGTSAQAATPSTVSGVSGTKMGGMEEEEKRKGVEPRPKAA